MASTWIIRANDRSFGPYTLEQMHSFAREGRLAPHSIVARDGSATFRTAGEDDNLVDFFRPTPPRVQAQPAAQPAPQPSQPRPVFFTAEGDVGQASGRREAEAASQVSRFLIMADMKSRSIAGLEEEIMRNGTAVRIMPQAWLLTTEQTINGLRNDLVQRLGRIDTLFVVDVMRNKAAWFGFGPEQDSRIRRVWQEAVKSQAAE
jgi:hypothetical protein